jgi:hypothetical protein
MKTHDSFADWYRGQSTHHKKSIAKLRKLVNDTAPKLLESSKWGNGVWLKGDLPIIYIHTKPDHLQFGFFAGANLSDPGNLLRGSGKYVRHIRVENTEDVDETVFATMIRKAVRAPAYR